MPEQTATAAGAVGRRDDLVASLSMTLGGTWEAVTQTVEQGGPVGVLVSNNGLAASFAGFVQADLIVFRLIGGGKYVWETRTAEVGFPFWRRARAGELLSPTTVVRHDLHGLSQYPESLIDTSGGGSRQSVGRTYAALSPLAPTASEAVSVIPPEVPGTSGSPSGVWSWCLVLRCFDVVRDPRLNITLPTPMQPAHHVKLACLHDGSA